MTFSLLLVDAHIQLQMDRFGQHVIEENEKITSDGDHQEGAHDAHSETSAANREVLGIPN
jgi:hypothetical protein